MIWQVEKERDLLPSDLQGKEWSQLVSQQRMKEVEKEWKKGEREKKSSERVQ